MRTLLALAACVLALGLAAVPAHAVACGSERCRLFRSAAEAQGDVAAGPDGSLWFAGNGFAGRMALNGAVTRFAAPVGPGSDVAGGADGATWLGAGDGRIARVLPDGAVSLVSTGFSVGPAALAGAPDGAMWFAVGSSVGWVTADGRSARFELPPYPPPPASPPPLRPSVGGPGALAAGPDGAMWVAEGFGRVHRVTPDGRFVTHVLPSFSRIGGLAAGPDGGMWFTAPDSKQVGRISPVTGRIVTFRTSQPPQHIAAGPSHALWFTMTSPGRRQSIVRMAPAGFQSFFQVEGRARGIAVGANDGIFVTVGDGILRLTPFMGARPIRSRALRVNPFAGSASLRLFCPKFDFVLCAGRITLRHRGRVLSSTPFSQRINDAPATRIVLNSLGRRLARQHARLRVRMTIVQHDQGGTTRRTTQNLYLRRRR